MFVGMVGHSGMPSDIRLLWKCLYKGAACCDDYEKFDKKENTILVFG